MSKCYVRSTSTEFRDWTKETNMSILPDSDEWTLSENAVGTLASVSGSILYLDTTPENAYWYYNRNWGADTNTGITVECKLKVISQSGNYTSLHLFCTDGTHGFYLGFYTDKVEIVPLSGTLTTHTMNTTNIFHVYRVTEKNGRIKLYVDGVLEIDIMDNYLSATNIISFGDVSSGVNDKASSEWDYVYYSTDGIFAPESEYFIPLKASLEKQTGSAVDSLTLTTTKDKNIDVNDTVEFYISEYKSDASWVDDVHKFTGIVSKTKVKNFKEVSVDSYGSVLNTVYVDKYYPDTIFIEDIVTDLVWIFCSDLGIASVNTISDKSNSFSLSKFLARGMLIDIVRQLAGIYGWIFRTDKDKNFYFEPETTNDYGWDVSGGNDGEVSSFEVGGLITDGIGSLALASWNKDYSDVFNRVILIGDTQKYGEEEIHTGTDGAWVTTDINWRPDSFSVYTSNMVWDTDISWITDSGSGWHTLPQIDTEGLEVYVLNKDDKSVTFATDIPSGFKVKFIYDYLSSIVADTGSVVDERSIQISDKSIRSYEDAEAFALKFLDTHKDPRITGKIMCNRYYYNLSDGLNIYVSDTQHSVSKEQMCVKKIKWDYPSGSVEMEVDNPETVIYDWEAQTSQRIRDLQDRLTSLEVARTFKSFSTDISIFETDFVTDAYSGSESIVATDYWWTMIRGIGTYPYKAGTGYYTYVGFSDCEE